MNIRPRGAAAAAGAVVLALVCLALPALAAEPKGKAKTYPARVLLIRHAEKPPEEDGSIHLSAGGKKRAAALHELFEASDERRTPFPVPDYVFAARESKRSNRCVETVAPLAKRLKLPVNSSFHNEDFGRLAQHLFRDPKYAGKTVLICWHHGTAPRFARKLNAADAPESWKKAAFDRVWEITYDEAGKATFRDRPQRLMAEDSAK